MTLEVPSASTLGSSAPMATVGEGTPRRLRSSWRWPVQNAKYPVYVQRSFRLKATSIASLQLLSVLTIMVLVREQSWDFDLKSIPMLATMTLSLVLSLALLSMRKADYPWNYMLLLPVTVLSGLVWGLGGAFLPCDMHFQIVGIMCITMMVAGLTMHVLSFLKPGRPEDLVALSFALAWSVAVVVDLTVAPMYDVSKPDMLGSLAITFLFILIFIFKVGPLLIDCDPDGFMTLVVLMNCTLLFMALPVLWTCGVSLSVSRMVRDRSEEGEEEDAPAGG